MTEKFWFIDAEYADAPGQRHGRCSHHDADVRVAESVEIRVLRLEIAAGKRNLATA